MKNRVPLSDFDKEFYKEGNWVNLRRVVQLALDNLHESFSNYPNSDAVELLNYYFEERLKDEIIDKVVDTNIEEEI